jgi:hypothetical protein
MCEIEEGDTMELQRFVTVFRGESCIRCSSKQASWRKHNGREDSLDKQGNIGADRLEGTDKMEANEEGGWLSRLESWSSPVDRGCTQSVAVQ